MVTSETRLADSLIREHPDRAAAVLERISVVDATRVLLTIRAHDAAVVMQRMSLLVCRSVLERLTLKRITEILGALDIDVCARLARQMTEERQRAVFEGLSARRVQSLRTLLKFPEHSAGALMDPDVLSLAEDVTAREALAQIRQAPRNTHYNVYVVDRQGELVGALNLRELFLAQPKDGLRDLMVPKPFLIDARATRSRVVAHPGWKVVHSLPVVDDQRRYVGAIRYSTLRTLEEDLFKRPTKEEDGADALGTLFAVGASGLLTALTTAGFMPERKE